RLGFACAQAPHARREKTRTEILERRRRTVEQFEHVIVCAREPDERRRKCEGLGADRRQLRSERVVRAERPHEPRRDVRERVHIRKILGHKMWQRLRHVEAAVGGETGGDRRRQADFGSAAARADVPHAITLAAGPLTGDTKLSLAMPARANASRISGAAASAAARVSNQANTLGPAPEMLAPIASPSRAACFTSANPLISAARRGSTSTSRSPARTSAASPRRQPLRNN